MAFTGTMTMSSALMAPTMASANRLSCKRAFTVQMPSLTSFRPVVSRSALQVVAANRNNKFPLQSPKPKLDNAFLENDPRSAFTRRREVFVGRLAMTGFFSAVIGELLTGEGVIGQLQLETRLPAWAVSAIIFGIVGFNTITALTPGLSDTFSEDNQRDVAKRPKGAVQDPNMNILNNPTGFLGISKGFGFTKKNELFVGRVAMLGFAADLIGEKLTHKGPLGQLGIPLNLPLNPEYAGFALAVWVGFFLTAAIGYGNFGQLEGDEEIY